MVRGFSLLQVLLAAVLAGSGSLLSAGFIIWAMSGWFCFLRRIRVISRVNAAGHQLVLSLPASGLSRTMAMSISPPSLWIMVGRPLQGLPLPCFHTKCVPIPLGLFALECHCGGALRAAVVPNALRKGLSGGVGDERC